jgi:SNF2 family DNA or RNA helicase
VLAYLTMARMACDSTELIMNSDSGLKCKVYGVVSCKMEELKSIVSQVEGKIIVFTMWAKMANIINKELNDCVLITGDTKDKQGAIEEFKNGNKKILVTTDCLNYGVNLQFCSNIVHFDLPWSSARIEQREGRCDRIGQKNSILIFKLLVKNSVEDRVVSLLENKATLFNSVIEGMDSVENRSFLSALFGNKEVKE